MNNIHATLVAIDGRGVLIEGPSGSGKSLLALHLYRRCQAADLPATLITDDQVLLFQEAGSLVGQAPTNLKNKIEVHGFGIVDLPPSKMTKVEIALHVVLGSPESITRFWDDIYFEFGDAKVKSLALSTVRLEAAGNAVLAAVSMPIGV